MIFDVAGVVLLFWLSPVDIEPVEDNTIRVDLSDGEKIEFGRDVDRRIDNVIRNNINYMIDRINRKNYNNKRKAKYALVFIVIGFMLQIASVFF